MAGGFPLGTRVELDLDGWVDVTPYVYARNPISITRGRAADASGADPASCRFTLDNRDDRFSMRNPLGPYFGLLRRNTAVRVSLPADVSGLRVQYLNPRFPLESRASTPDGPGLVVTGDLDLRVEIDAGQWWRGTLFGKYLANDTGREWALFVQDGRLNLLWSADGTGATRRTVTSVPLPDNRLPARRAVRAVLTLNDGAGGHVVTFYTAATMAGPWTVFDTVAGPGVQTVYNSAVAVEAGRVSGIAGSGLPGVLVAAEVRSGGSVLASPDFSAQPAGTLTFTDAQGNLWTVGADAEISDRDVRFCGEVSQWPQTRDVADVDKTVEVTAYGVRRRVSLNSPSLDSVMVREFSSPRRASIVAYWPMEETAGATALASAFPGAPAMKITGTPRLGDYDSWPASKPVPRMATGKFFGTIPAYDTSTNEIALRMFVDIKAPTSDQQVVLLRTTTALWTVYVTSSGAMYVNVLDTSGELLYYSSAVQPWAMHTRGFVSLAFELVGSGSSTTFKLLPLDFQGDQVWNQPIPTVGPLTATVARPIGVAKSLTLGQFQGLGDTAVGHVAVANRVNAYAATAGALNVWNGETAEERLYRLAKEDGITVRVDDGGGEVAYANSHHLGDQTVGTWLGLLEDVEASDLGVLAESRSEIGFVYRNRYSLTNQPARLALDYDQAEVSGDLRPVDDDDALINDVRVTRADGGSYRMEDTESALSVFPPPLGAGRYPDDVTISAQSDEWLPDQAGFRLRMGTVDQARYPTLLVELHNPRVSDDQARRVRRLDVGDRLDVLHADAWTPTVGQIVTGYVEELQVTTHRFTFNLTPADPWSVGVVDVDRYDTAGSELAAPPPPDPVAPAFVDADVAYWNAAAVPVPVVDGAFVVACLVWNTTADITPPAGWTLRRMLTASSSRAAVYTAPGNVASWAFSLSAASKTSIAVVGYSAADVAAVDGLLDAGTDATHEAPALAVPAGPARLVRFYWEKSSTATTWTANDPGAAVRGTQFGTGGGAVSVLATDQVVSAGTAPAASATANLATGQAGGFTIALRSTEDPPPPGDGASETDTALTVVTRVGPRWTTDPADLPFDVMCGGERMTVTAISGTGTTQVFTVTRGVNGVVKAHDAGSDIRLAAPAYVTL